VSTTLGLIVREPRADSRASAEAAALDFDDFFLVIGVVGVVEVD